MTKSKLVALSLPVFFTAFSVWVFVTGRAMGENLGLFPRIIGVFTLIVSLFHLIDVLRHKDQTNNFENSNVLMVLTLLGVIAVYIVLFKRLGYMICTSALMFYVITAQGYKKYLTAGVVSVAFSGVVFLIFKMLLKVPLPTLLQF